MILLCHRFDNKGRRRKRGNLQRKKKQKQKQKKLKSKAIDSRKPTKFYEQLKRGERERERERQYIEIKESQKHVLITSK